MAIAVRPIVHSIRNEREYNASIREIDRLLTLAPQPGTPEDDRLDLLSVLVEAYESENGYDLPDASPQELVHFMLDQRGMTRASLAGEMGGRSRVSQFFRGERALSLNQIIKLHELLNIPTDLLITKPRGTAKGSPPVSPGSTRRAPKTTARRK
jgi:HTH-type transcriptional regulator/antitoxin HigA